MGAAHTAGARLLLLCAIPGLEFVCSQRGRQTAATVEEGLGHCLTATWLPATRSFTSWIRGPVPHSGHGRGGMVHGPIVSIATVVSMLRRRSQPISVPPIPPCQESLRAQCGSAIHSTWFLHGPRLPQTRPRAHETLHRRGGVVGIAAIPTANTVPSARGHSRRTAHLHLPVRSANQRIQWEDILRCLVLSRVSHAFECCQLDILVVAHLPLQSTSLRSPVPVAYPTGQHGRGGQAGAQNIHQLSGLGRGVCVAYHWAQPRLHHGHPDRVQTLGVLRQSNENARGQQWRRQWIGCRGGQCRLGGSSAVHFVALVPCHCLRPRHGRRSSSQWVRPTTVGPSPSPDNGGAAQEHLAQWLLEVTLAVTFTRCLFRSKHVRKPR